MRTRILLLALCAALALPTVVAAATPAPACGDAFAAERLTAEGLEMTFDAAQPPAPELQAANHPALTAGRSANFYVVADLAPVPSAKVTMNLSWAQTGDYDLFVFDEDGNNVAGSFDANIEDPDVDPLGEELTMKVSDCQVLHIAARSWAGGPQPLTLSLTVTDPAQAVADLEPRTGDRTIHYLGGGRPGQIAMTHGAPNNLDTPQEIRSRLTADRPTGNRPNSYTRPPVGFNDPQNLLQAHFTTPIEEPRSVSGVPTARVWLSTPAQSLPADQSGTFFVRLFLDGTEVGEPVAIPATAVNPWPTPFLVEFEDVNRMVRSSATLQVSSEPVASSTGTTSAAGNGAFTLWYDSVQYPSNVMLP